MNPPPLPGLHLNVPFEDYQSWDAVNFSTLKNIRGTASKCKYAMDNPKEMTDAMKNGQTLHVATLEPGRFDGMFHICPPANGTTKEGKEILAYNTQLASDAKKIMIRQRFAADESKLEALEAYKGMAASIHRSKAARMFLKAQGQNEVSMLWNDAETGLMCKGRIDRLCESLNYVVEIKSTRDADDWSFGKDVASMGYHAQAACYLNGLRNITGKSFYHVIIAVESVAPFDLKVHMLDDAAIQIGLLKYREWLTRFAECKKTNQWPGYPDVLNKLELPKYAS